MMAEWLAAVDIGDMNLNYRQVRGQKRIKQGDGGMTVPCRVDHDPPCPPAALLNPGNQLTFGVGLAEIYRQAKLFGRTQAKLLHVVQRGPTVYFGFTLAEHVQVRAVQNSNERSFHNRAGA